jgi:hypothetical protein
MADIKTEIVPGIIPLFKNFVCLTDNLRVLERDYERAKTALNELEAKKEVYSKEIKEVWLKILTQISALKTE